MGDWKKWPGNLKMSRLSFDKSLGDLEKNIQQKNRFWLKKIWNRKLKLLVASEKYFDTGKGLDHSVSWTKSCRRNIVTFRQYKRFNSYQDMTSTVNYVVYLYFCTIVLLKGEGWSTRTIENKSNLTEW